ncbi:LysR family transcriptional regulator [Saliterribacillus persicus]|uniref:LysR family transcriptional regulator n=1 Tax=Saliterribacillus persicus TaxID=930114 RepID=A0A368YAG1_9BACI|nr:LysR family transcriptional regulator [Saliterribacillus persicus]RCW77250.1 LysR family transcriptional regulator [Saliterribacillus persicus]
MDMLDLRILVELFEKRSISKVAKNLPLSYSAINARLLNMESEVGVRLFIRTSRGTELTDAAEKFYYFAYKSLLSLETGLSIARQSNSQKKKEDIQIGITRPLIHLVAPVFTNLMNTQKTPVAWNIQTGFTLELMLLTNGEALDMSIINHNKFIPDSLEQEKIFSDPIHLVGAKGQKLPNYQELYHILSRVPLILLKKGFPLRELIEEELFKPMGFVPKQVIEVDSMDIVRQLMCDGVGYSFMPEMALLDRKDAFDLEIYASDIVIQTFHMVYLPTFYQEHQALIADMINGIRTTVKNKQAGTFSAY